MSSIGDTLGYLVFGNPISQSVINTASTVVKAGQEILPKKAPTERQLIPKITMPTIQLRDLIGSRYHFVRLAGISGAAAVLMGAYGKHRLSNIPELHDRVEAQAVFEVANRFHFLHSFALFAMPLAHKPFLTGSLMVAGTLLFSGTMYYRAFTGDTAFVPVAAFGGFCLIAAWLTLVY